MLNKEFVINATEYNNLLNKLKDAVKTEEQLLTHYLADLERTYLKNINIKRVAREKRLNGNIIITYCVYEEGELDG